MPLERLNTIEIDFKQGHIVIGAGAKLGDVYRALDPYNMSAIIGRYDKVGLSLAIAAGFSFFSNRDGFAVDNVVNYEVVLGNGTIVNANATNHVDLFWALKGGNNNLGVVTYYSLRTVPTPGSAYGGIVYYPESSLDKVADVIYNYHTRQATQDVLTHVLPQYGFNGTTNETINFSPVIYNATVDELPEIMQPWLEVPYTKSTLHERNYSSIAVELNDGFPDGAM